MQRKQKRIQAHQWEKKHTIDTLMHEQARNMTLTDSQK